MKLRNARMEHSPQIMIIPMIDIIFFLLVFFMMSTLYMTSQETIPVNLPAAASARQDVVKSLQVTVSSDGRLYLGKEAMNLPQLKEKLMGEAKTADIAVSLRADKDVDYGTFIAVMDELKTSGIQRISLAAKQ
ncbi:MAG: biopolymer transporter ExbD [Selenomonas sp.]|nr:biopolymer transporter ExbD [Selenomonas sp.]